MADHTSRDVSREQRRVLIVDDHPLVRQGLAQLINQEADLEVCGEAADARQAQEAVAALCPDLAIVDLSLHESSGLDLIKTLREQAPTLPILVVSMHEETLYAERVLRAGARGYIMKQEAMEQVLKAIRRVLHGKVHVSKRMTARLLQTAITRSPRAKGSAMESLSDRELEILRLLGEGNSSRHVAEVLHLSVKTIEAHRANIMKKLQIKNALELVRYAMHWADSLLPG